MSRVRPGQSERVVYVGPDRIAAFEGILEGRQIRIRAVRSEKNPEGFEKGLVSNLERAASSLGRLVTSLSPKGSAEQGGAASVVLGNSKLRTFGFSSSQYFQGLERPVTPQEIRSVVRQTRSVATLPLSEFVLQALPEAFLVNDMENVANPLGLETRRLGVTLKFHTMDFQDFRNITKAFEGAEIDVEEYFPKTLAISEAVLSDSERENGAVVMDLEDEMISLIAWKNGNILDTRILDPGPQALHVQIAQACQVELSDALKLRELYGSLEVRDFGEELIPLAERGVSAPRRMRRQNFHEQFLAHAAKWMGWFFAAADEFARERRVHDPHLILTGSLSSMDGLLEFMQKEFARSARLGTPRQIEAAPEVLTDSALAPGLGMYRWFAGHRSEFRQFFEPQGFMEKTFASARDWFLATF